MRTFTAFLMCISVFSNLCAQDLIIKTSGDEISSKVIEVGKDIVKFKKYENLEGSIYTILKQDIFMIKYENGSKDIFLNDNPSPTTTSYDKRKEDFEINEELNKYKVEHKSKRVVYDYQFDISKVIEASSIYYYGVDFSAFILVNPRKLGQEDKIKKYISAWFTYFEKDIPPQKYLKRWIRKEELVLKQHTLQELNMEINREWITYSVEGGIPIEQVIELTKELHRLIEEDKGIGFVILIDSFDKQSRFVTGIYNFFDIATGELLWSAKVVGDAGGHGMTKYWGHGMISSLKNYIDDVYRD